MKYLRGWALPITALAWCLTFSVNAMAQSGTGVLSGTVLDEKGGSLPGAVVAIREVATGAVRTAPTNTDGTFRVPALPPGRYSVEVTMDGFAPLNVPDVSLAPTQVLDLGKLSMKVGGRTETVSVTAAAVAVQTTSSTRSGTVTSDQLTNIMQKGRDLWGLMSVLPGVQDTNMNRAFTTWTSMAEITINGMPNTSKVVVIDGVNVIDELGTQAQVNPNIDAVGEVQVISNGFTAENGRSNGGLIVITTKSGTSSFKGSSWYNARRQEWRANEYFRIKQNLAKSLYHVNIPGYSIGGPVIIPNVLPKGKVFFFASQEFTDDLRPSGTSTTNYPTALERAGDFSQTFYGNANGPGQGTLNQILDWTNTVGGVAQPFPGNVIPANRINPLGAKMLNLLPLPNGAFDPASNQYNRFNYLVQTLPIHGRTNNTLRMDVVLSEKLRGSFRFIKDREDNIGNNTFAPGIGWANNAVPGYIATGGVTKVVSSSIVNETTFGFAHNTYSWVPAEGKYYEDYRQYYQSALGVAPPRLEPFGPYRDPQGMGYNQYDEYPYVPQMQFSGGNRTNLVNYNPASGGGRILPASNRNDRWTFADDLSWTRGRHSYKFGVSTEWASKTEPLGPAYRGVYNFGHDAQNPFSTGNGYANALLGVFTTYTELTNRVDPDRRHWYTEGYAQDSWRVKRNFTLDYGVRMTHTGAYHDARGGTAGFYEQGWKASQAARLYYPTCTTAGYTGNQTCAAGNQRAVDLANPGVLLPSAYIGNLVPGTGTLVNGMIVDGYPGMRKGEYFTFTPFVAAPRIGFAWDIKGDGKQALRASTGIFYAIPTRGFGDGWEAYYQPAKPPAAFTRVVRWAQFSDIENFATSGKAFVETPTAALVAGGEQRSLERSYNLNVTYQREIGFGTTAEIAYVGGWNYTAGRGVDINRPKNNVFLLSDPSRMFNGNALDTNFLRTVYPGMGAITKWVDQSTGTPINNNTLRYNSMQVSVQRRLRQGLQAGLAYTWANGVGWNSYSPDIIDADASGALNRTFFWGPTSNNRVHNLNINYSYMIPAAAQGVSGVKWLLRDWQVSGVTKFLTGQATQPSCSTTASGIQNTNPTLTPGQTAKCVYTGEPVFTFTTDKSLPEDEQLHFNPKAFAMAVPVSSTIGNFGNVPNGILRQPSFWNHDLTLARRFPITKGAHQVNARVQLQLYNIFNTAQFTSLSTGLAFADDPNVAGVDSLLLTSTQVGRYVNSTNPPREFGITVRLDF